MGHAVFHERAIKEADDLIGSFQKAVGFGFQSNMYFPAGLVAKLVKDEGAIGKMDRVSRIGGRVVRGICAISERKGADAAVGMFGKELGEDSREEHGIVQPFAGRPVGTIDFGFDRFAMEVAVRKTVDGEGIEILFLHEVPEAGKGVRLTQCFRRLAG